MRPKTNQLMLISTNIKLLLKITLGKTCKVVEDEDGGWFHYYGTTKITLSLTWALKAKAMKLHLSLALALFGVPLHQSGYHIMLYLGAPEHEHTWALLNTPALGILPCL